MNKIELTVWRERKTNHGYVMTFNKYQSTKKNVILQAIVVSVFIFANPQIANAGQKCYEAMPVKAKNGKISSNHQVCDALTKNLNQFCEKPPMVCELEVHPKYRNQIVLPSWKPAPEQADIHRAEAFTKAPWLTTANSSGGNLIWNEWRPRIEQALSHKTLIVESTYIDLLNRGRQDHVLRFSTGECATELDTTNADPHRRDYFNTNGIRTNLAPEVFAALAKNSSKKSLLPTGSSGFNGSPFRYKGATFVQGMHFDKVIVRKLSGLRPNSAETLMCSIQRRCPDVS